MTNNTRDLMQFGNRELKLAGELLSALKTEKDKTRFLSHGVAVEFNPNSGNVFIVDEDYNVAMMNGDTLEDFFSCPECGHEGFLEDFEHHSEQRGCKDYETSIANA